MDLGLRGKTAIVSAASKGLGRSCALSLAREGVNVVISARGEAALLQTAEDIARETGAQITPVVADIATEAGQAAVLKACPNPDILVNNAGGPPPGNFRDWDRDDWIKALDANMLSAIFMIKATVDGMMDRGFGRVVNITSGAVKAPINILGLSNGARTGLTGFVAGLARETVSRNVTINNLLPGSFATDRLQATLEGAARAQGTTVAAAAEARLSQVPARRFGTPAEFGDMCAYVCSVQAGYITGQNLLIDGGAYPGTF